jgi:hypothetical protein
MSDKILKGMEIEKPKSPNLSNVRVSPLKISPPRRRRKKGKSSRTEKKTRKSPISTRRKKKSSVKKKKAVTEKKSPSPRKKSPSPKRKAVTEKKVKKSPSPKKKSPSPKRTRRSPAKKKSRQFKKSAALEKELKSNSPAEYTDVVFEVRDNYAKLVFYYVLRNKVSASKAVDVANSRMNKFFYGVKYPREMEKALTSIDNSIKILAKKFGYNKLLDRV